MRSTEKGEGAPPLAKAKASLEEAPPESSSIKASESLVEQNLSTVTRLSELESNTEEWESGILTWCVSAWETQAAVSETRVAKARDWETHALEAQVRGGPQPKPSATKEVTVTTSEETRYMSREESDVFLPRQLWSSKLKFILAMVSYLLMPIQLWRFVSQWLHKGGCSFLIMYTIMLFWIGIPLLFLEMAVGQRVQRASIDLWKTLGPWFGGLGYSTFLVCFIINTYTNLFNSWILFYMSHIFYFTVPWQHCPLQRNSSSFDPECEQATSYTYFWYRQTLKAADRIEDGGPLAFNLGICLFLAWCLVCVFIMNGIKSFEKVLNVLVLLPYLVIFCFFFRTLPMEGTVYGLKYLLVLEVASIYDPIVWSQAGVQVMLDMGLGFGPIVYLSSYMPDFNNCLGDAFLMVLIKMLTLLLFVPFILSILGFWATITTHRCCEKNTEKLMMLVAQGILPPEVRPPTLTKNPTSTYNSWLDRLPPPLRSAVLSKVPECNIQEHFLKIEESPRFVFLIFTEVISLLPGSFFWTVLFFLLLLSLSLCAMVTFMLGIITPLQDTFPFFRRQPRILTVGASVLMFLCGLFFIQPSGIYYYWLLSEYWIVLPIISIALCENLAVAWAYRAKRFLADMMALLSRPICPICGWVWCYVSPVVLLGLLIAVFIQMGTRPLTYTAWNSSTSKETVQQYPMWALILTVGLYVIVLIPIPAYFAYCLTLGIPFRPTASPKLSSGSGQPLTKKEASEDIPRGYKTKSSSA